MTQSGPTLLIVEYCFFWLFYSELTIKYLRLFPLAEKGYV